LPPFVSSVPSKSRTDTALMRRFAEGSATALHCFHFHVAQIGIGAFIVGAVPKAHKRDFRIDASGRSYFRHMPHKVPLFPRQPTP
jgi:hypothetical protein